MSSRVGSERALRRSHRRARTSALLDAWERRLSTLPLRRASAWLGALFVAVAAACWLAVALVGGLPGDSRSAAEVREQHFGWIVLAPAHALDWLGHPLPGALTVALLAACTWRRTGWRSAALVLAAEGAVGLAWVIKLVASRARPAGSALRDSSFPSGHTAWAVALFGLVAVLAVRRRSWRPAAACALIAGMMGPSRVLLGVHWLSDVIAGYAIGLAWLIALLLVGLPWMARTRAGR